MYSKLVAGVVLGCGLAGQAAALDLLPEDMYDDEGRLLVIPIGTGTTTNGLSLNLTTLAGIASLLASGLITLLGLGALGFLLYSLFAGGGGSGYSGSGGSGYGGGSSYSSYRRSFDPYSIDWEKFSILDWIAIGQEAWEKFDPADADCQLRLICEVHQNTSKFGLAAQKMVDVFSYLQFLEVLSLPDEVKVLVEEWLNAADMGRNNRKECGEIFQTCDFSVNKMVDKYTHNEI